MIEVVFMHNVCIGLHGTDGHCVICCAHFSYGLYRVSCFDGYICFPDFSLCVYHLVFNSIVL